MPEGLAETYRRILLKLQKSAWKTKIAAKAFRWIACAQRPLQVDELKEAIVYEKSDTSWRSAESTDDEQLIRSFGALVCVDTEDRTIRFVHHTVLQFLFSTEEISPIFHFSQAQAQCFVGEMCVVYLGFSDFETSITQRPPKRKVQDTAMFQSGAMSTIPNVLGVGRSIFRIAYRLYGGKQATTRPTVDHAKLLVSLHKPVESIEPVSSMLAKKYRLLDYVITYWDYHTKWLEEENMETWRSFRDLALYKKLPFEFRKWGLNEHHGSDGCNSCERGSSDDASQELPFTTLIHYAAQIGHVPLLRLFRTQEAGSCLEDYLGHEDCRPFLRACLNDQRDVVEHVLNNYAEHVDPITMEMALHWAASMGYENTLCTLLPYAAAAGADLSTALQGAIRKGMVSCAERLITAGAEVDVSITKDQAALQAAKEGGFDSTIAMLIQRDQLNAANVHVTVSEGLSFAAMRGLTLTFSAMIQKGVPIDDIDSFGKTALHHAAEEGDSRAIRLLLEHGSDVNAIISRGNSDSSGLTALHLAVKHGQTGAIQLLLDHGSDINAATSDRNGDYSGLTALRIAAMHGHTDAVQILCERGSDVNAYTNSRDVNSNGLTALHFAAMYGYTDAVQILCEYGARVNERGGSCAYTSLHLAARNGYEGTILKLLEHGADINQEDPQGWTPLDHAIEYNKKIAEICLRELGALRGSGRIS